MHNVSFVHQTQKIVAQYIKETFLSVNIVHYFNDGWMDMQHNKRILKILQIYVTTKMILI